MAFEGSKTLAEQIAKHLTERIIRNEFAPGERILEAKLAEELGVSRSPIREAFRILERLRLLEVSPHRGVRVTEISPETREQVSEVMTEIMVLLAKRAARYRREADIPIMWDIHAGMKPHADAGDYAAYYEGALRGFTLVREMAQSPVLEDLLNNLMPTVQRLWFGSLAEQRYDLGENWESFIPLLSQIAASDPEQAAVAMREYVGNEWTAWGLEDERHSLSA